MRFHVVGLPYSQTTAAHCVCAFTQNIIKFCEMMTARGHEIVLYSGVENEAHCSEHVEVFSSAQQVSWFGSHDRQSPYPVSWEHSRPYWCESNQLLIKAIRPRLSKDDILCLITGRAQQAVALAFPSTPAVEYAIGYEGPVARYRCFASRALRQYVCGWHREPNGRATDTVIPHYFNPAEFSLGVRKENYCLFVGRMVWRKGIAIAAAACRAAGMKLVVAGPGARKISGGIEFEGSQLRGDFEYVGAVDKTTRGSLMSRARALFVPTQYFEPFGMVAVEAMLSGTPVITSDWGALPEIVPHGVVGFNCNTPAEYAGAIAQVGNLSPAQVREYAMRFSYDAVAPQYEAWFTRLAELRSG